MKIDAIIFDLDGTLWDCNEQVYSSWCKCIEERDDITKQLTYEELKSAMGLNEQEFTAKLFPEQSIEFRKEIFARCCEVENKLLAEVGGKAFDGMAETLRELSQTRSLAIVSNCGEGYIEAYLASMGTAECFSDTENAGRTGLSKAENIRLVAERNGYKNPVYVGDTVWDKISAETAGVPFVFAEYGFGDIEDCEFAISNPSELINVIKSIENKND